MIILSLFDGISCGRLALERAGITVNKYYTSEIDKYAASISRYNWPDNIELGDVTNWRDWNIDWPNIDLLIGGSPCQSFSVAGKGEGFAGKSGLFYEYVNILNHIKQFNSDIKFLLENVKMKAEWRNVISQELDVDPILINAATLSAQNRERYYWCNWPVSQPEDKWILLESILEPPVDVTAMKNRGEIILRPYKSTCLDADYWRGVDNHDQRTCILAGRAEDVKGFDMGKRVYSPRGKCPTLNTMQGGSREPKVALSHTQYKKLSPIECERLQTVPDNYTMIGNYGYAAKRISNTQRYKAIGNSWCVDVIAHIFRAIK